MATDGNVNRNRCAHDTRYSRTLADSIIMTPRSRALCWRKSGKSDGARAALSCLVADVAIQFGRWLVLQPAWTMCRLPAAGRRPCSRGSSRAFFPGAEICFHGLSNPETDAVRTGSWLRGGSQRSRPCTLQGRHRTGIYRPTELMDSLPQLRAVIPSRACRSDRCDGCPILIVCSADAADAATGTREYGWRKRSTLCRC